MAMTGTAAQICGISDRYGSLTVGKKADFTVFSGDPLDVRSNVCLFVGGGVVRYDPDSLSQSQNDFRASAEPSVSQRVEETTK
jgi:predicted amidohydrolase